MICLPIAYCLLPISYCLLPIAYCLLPIAYCLLPVAYFLLPIAIAYCLLPIAYYLLPMPSPCHGSGPRPFGLPWAGPPAASSPGLLCGWVFPPCRRSRDRAYYYTRLLDKAQKY